MIEPAALMGETHVLSHFLHDPDGNLRAALLCWGIVVGALVVLRVPRQVVFACLVVAGATVGLASVLIDATPVDARVSASPSPQSPASYRMIPLRGPAPADGRHAQQ
ncbi:MAG TPA: hypothetical protein VGF43_24530 [Dongiaceae bacterium]